MTGHPHFPKAAPVLVAVTAAIDDPPVAHVAAISRLEGAAAVRNEKRGAFVAARSLF